MKVLYFDAFNGIAGDMVLGALIDMGLPVDHLQSELSKLGLEGYELHSRKIDRDGLFGTDFSVAQEESSVREDEVEQELHSRDHEEHHHSHGSGHGHLHSHHTHVHPSIHAEHEGHRGFSEISELIESSRLESRIRERAVSIFQNLARAEAKVHQRSIEDVHFHEVGALDAIVDIVGACIGFEYFEIERFYSSPLALGGGTVSFSHGTWPVPAPATVELLRDFPTQLGPVEAELTTPTGAAIVSTLAEKTRPSATLKFSTWGFGAGDREFEKIPNMLRLMLAVEEGETSPRLHREKTILLEANIDDMDPQIFGRLLDTALAAGALDVFFTHVQMKKNRPGIHLSLLCHPEDKERLAELVFKETTTLGIRILPHERYVLAREERRVDTSFGPILVKIGKLGDEVINVSPEFDDLSRISSQIGLPLKQLRNRILAEISEIEQ